MNTDGDLLRCFAAQRDEACFAQLVERHIGFVYAVCVRRLRDAHAAKDATQAVFIALARKAGKVAEVPNVPGWLHRSACYETRNMIRSQSNRLARETEAHHLGTVSAEPAIEADLLGRVLDDALCELSERDRDAILARYFSRQSHAEIAAALNVTENAARMRVDRALTKLRDCLVRRGITSTAAVLAGALPSYAAQAIPGSLAVSVTKMAVVGVSATAAVGGALSFMSTAKIAIGLGLLVLASGLAYEHERASEIRSQVADVKAAAAQAHEQLRTIQQQLADVQRTQAAAATAASAASKPAKPLPIAAATVQPPAPPILGVTPVPPKGWHKNGSGAEFYEVGVDANNTWGGLPSAYAKSTTAEEGRFGGMMQTIAADAYLNQRVKLTGWIKTADAANGGNLWLRVDGRDVTKPLQFDNMAGRAPKGTTDWQEYSIVVDVPPDAVSLNYGFFVAGKGQIWVNGLTITPVSADVPSTNLVKAPQYPKSPVNLGFSGAAGG
jgi:RNA polymerase sigma factor (sigma-70 family)